MKQYNGTAINCPKCGKPYTHVGVVPENLPKGQEPWCTCGQEPWSFLTACGWKYCPHCGKELK